MEASKDESYQTGAGNARILSGREVDGGFVYSGSVGVKQRPYKL
jgi:hypothetical protein